MGGTTAARSFFRTVVDANIVANAVEARRPQTRIPATMSIHWERVSSINHTGIESVLVALHDPRDQIPVSIRDEANLLSSSGHVLQKRLDISVGRAPD
jgi:hypothetical protein